jgi:hypothetical protein
MRRVFARHWEKLALGVAIAATAGYLLFGIALAGSNDRAASAVATTRRLDTELASRPLDDASKPAGPARVAAAFGPIVSAAPGGAWAFYAPAQIHVVLKPAASPADAVPKRIVRLKPPALAAVVPEIGMVRLAWEDDPETTVRVTGYQVYRRLAADAEFSRISAEPVPGKGFVDDRVAPKQIVQYAVAAVTDDAEAAQLLKLGPSGVGPRSEPRSVRTLGTFQLALRIVSRFPPNRPGGEPVVLGRVTVLKFVEGTWLEKDYSVKAGDRIGNAAYVQWQGRPQPVDFTTGFEVVSIAPAKAQRNVRISRPVFDPKTARKIGEEDVTVSRETETWKLTYRDEEGAVREILQEERATPAAPAARPGVPAVKPGVPVAPAPREGGRK